MATARVTVRLKGKATQDGTIELNQLVNFASDFQAALNRVEYAILKENSRIPNYDPAVQKSSLRLLGTGNESFDLFMEVIESPQQAFVENSSVQALEVLVRGLEDLQRFNDTDFILPFGYDSGVLVSIQKVGSILKHGIDVIEIDVATPAVEQIVEYTYPLLAQVNRLIPESEERIEAVQGHLLSVNFKGDKNDKYRCRIYRDDGGSTPCSFDEDVADEIDNALRRYVSAIGIARIEPVSETIESLHIKDLIVFTDDYEASVQAAKQALEEYRSENDTLAKFREGWQQAMRGETRPISTLWDFLDDE